MGSLSTVRTKIVVAGITMPDSIVIYSFAFGATIAGIGITVVLTFDFLSEGWGTLRSIILMRWCRSLQIRQSLHCLNSQDRHSRVAFLPHTSHLWSPDVIFSNFLMWIGHCIRFVMLLSINLIIFVDESSHWNKNEANSERTNTIKVTQDHFLDLGLIWRLLRVSWSDSVRLLSPGLTFLWYFVSSKLIISFNCSWHRLLSLLYDFSTLLFTERFVFRSAVNSLIWWRFVVEISPFYFQHSVFSVFSWESLGKSEIFRDFFLPLVSSKYSIFLYSNLSL